MENNFSNLNQLEKNIKDFFQNLATDKVIFIATNNEKKIYELKHLGKEFNYTIVTPKDVEIQNDPDETGNTYEENALIKAIAWSEIIHRVCPNVIILSEDSGFCIDAWNQAPGLYSHRYILETANGCPTRNVANILKKMENEKNRIAHYICCMAVIMNGQSFVVYGKLFGELIYSPRGNFSVGYDTMFQLPCGKTLAEMDLDEKNKISHRRIAFEKAIKEIEKRI